MTDLTAHEARQALARWVLDECEPYKSLYPAETAGTLARYVLEADAALAASRALVEQMREAGQALRDSFPDSSWQHSTAAADAADAWDALAAVPESGAS